MNYYQRHIGDYAKDTAHLSILEHGVYSILMDVYYATEKGIADAQRYRLARARTEDERSAVDAVLQEFFTLEDGVWLNGRCESEIEQAVGKSEKARASINARWNKAKAGHTVVKPTNNERDTNESDSKYERNTNVIRTNNERNTNQETNNQLPPTPPKGDPPSSEVEPPTLKLECDPPPEPEPDWFADFMAAYPKRAGGQAWPRARKLFALRLKQGIDPNRLLEGVKRYREFCEATGKIRTEKTMQASRWLGDDEAGWEQEWSLPIDVDDHRWRNKQTKSERERESMLRAVGL